MLAVEGKQDASAGELWEELSAKTATEMATLMRTEDLWQQRMNAAEIYLGAGRVLLLIIVVLALIGTGNNLVQSYRAREDEFRLYGVSGMSSVQVRNMKCMEILTVVLFGIVLAFLVTLLFLIVTNVALRAHAYETFLNIGHYFKIK